MGTATTRIPTLVLASVLLGATGPAAAREALWELDTAGDAHADEVRELLAKKRAQEALMRDVVDALWGVHEVHVSSPQTATPYDQFSVPDKVRFVVPVGVGYDANVLSKVSTMLRSREFQEGDQVITFRLPQGQFAIRLYDEVVPIFDKLTDQRDLTYVCRVVLLDENQEVLVKSDSFLYARVVDLDFTRSPWVGNYRRVNVPEALKAFGPPQPMGGAVGAEIEAYYATLFEDLQQELNGFLGQADDFYILESSDHIQFDYLPLEDLERVHSVRVLRPDDALLLYRGK